MTGEQGLMKHLPAAAMAVGVAAMAASAPAQTVASSPPNAPLNTAAVAQALRQALAVSGRSSPLPLSFAQADAPRTPGVARTAVDHRFGDGGVTGSAGFLCGRGAGPDNNGAATAYGYDPEGRFVGAKLSFAFK